MPWSDGSERSAPFDPPSVAVGVEGRPLWSMPTVSWSLERRDSRSGFHAVSASTCVDWESIRAERSLMSARVSSLAFVRVSVGLSRYALRAGSMVASSCWRSLVCRRVSRASTKGGGWPLIPRVRTALVLPLSVYGGSGFGSSTTQERR